MSLPTNARALLRELADCRPPTAFQLTTPGDLSPPPGFYEGMEGNQAMWCRFPAWLAYARAVLLLAAQERMGEPGWSEGARTAFAEDRMRCRGVAPTGRQG